MLGKTKDTYWTSFFYVSFRLLKNMGKDCFLLFGMDAEGGLPAAFDIVSVQSFTKGERSNVIDFCNF